MRTQYHAPCRSSLSLSHSLALFLSSPFRAPFDQKTSAEYESRRRRRANDRYRSKSRGTRIGYEGKRTPRNRRSEEIRGSASSPFRASTKGAKESLGN